MLAGERRQDVLANNLANVNTTGYKKDDSVMRSFPEMLLYSLNDHTGSGPQAIAPGMPSIGAVGTGAFLEEVLPRFTQGILKQTANPYGYAIIDAERPDPNDKRKTFFVLNGENGESLFSRDGDFHLTPEDANRNAFLVNAAGLYVQAVDGEGKPVSNSRIRLREEGTGLEAGRMNGDVFEPDPDLRFAAVDVANTDRLRDLGNGAYRLVPAAPDEQAEDLLLPATGEIRKGFLEGSNVDVSETMVDMIAVMRSYEANQRMIRTLDNTLDKAVNVLGRI